MLWPPVCSVVLTRTVPEVGPHTGEILPYKVGVKGSAHHTLHTTHHTHTHTTPHTAHHTHTPHHTTHRIPHSTHHTPQTVHHTPHTTHHTPHTTPNRRNTTKVTQSPNACSSTCFFKNKGSVLIQFFWVVFQPAWGWPNCAVLSPSARNVFH